MDKATYGQIYRAFREQFPNVEIDEYRPATFPNTIIVWAKDGWHYLYHYISFFDEGFIIGKSSPGIIELPESIPSALKPCPFCGKPARMKTDRHLPCGEEYTPQCIDPSCAGRLLKKWIDKQKAIDAWNRRVDNG